MCFMNLDYRRLSIHARYVVIFTSILLKNSSCHFYHSRFFRSESGCKDKAFLSFLPNLFRSFFKLFSRGPVQDRSRCKRSSSTPLERRLHVNLTPSFILPLSRFSGCKDKVNIYPFPNFSTTFFQTFFRNRRRRKLLQASSAKDEKHISQNVSERPLRFGKRLQR